MIATCGCVTDGRRREVKEHGSFDFPAACYLNDAGSLPVPWHWHDELEVIVVEKGSLTVKIASAQRELSEGCGCFINAGALHAMEKKAGACALERCIVFHPRLVGGNADSVFWQKYVGPLILDRSFPGLFLDPSVSWQREILSHIRAAWEFCAGEEGFYEMSARNELSSCIGILRQRQPLARKDVSQKALRQTGRMKVMLAFLQERFDEALTVSRIAASASVSESECLRCFRQTVGIAPIAYLKHYRLQRAAELLQGTDLPVAAVASRCGFLEMSYFSREFRKMYGAAPTQYRRENAEAAGTRQIAGIAKNIEIPDTL